MESTEKWSIDWKWYDELLNEENVMPLIDLYDVDDTDQLKCRSLVQDLMSVFSEPNHGSTNTKPDCSD